MKNKKWVVAVDFLSGTLIVLAVFIYLFSGLPISALRTIPILYILGMLLSGLVLMITFGLFQFKAGLTDHSFDTDTTYFLIGFGTIFAVNAIGRAFPSFISTLPSFVKTIPSLAVEPTSLKLVRQLVSVAEEVLFRGFLSPWVANHIGFWAAVFLAGGSFGAYHVYTYGDDLSAFFVVTALGMIFTIIALRTGRLWVTIGDHFVNNFLAG